MPFRSYHLPMVAVDSPAVSVQSTAWSWAQLALGYTSWTAVKTGYASWADEAANTPL
jgi:hypothetical protein